MPDHPPLAVLIRRPTAAEDRFARGDRVWVWQAAGWNHGRGTVVPAIFDRYGVIRAAVVITDDDGRDHRLYLNPRNVYARRASDCPGDPAGL